MNGLRRAVFDTNVLFSALGWSGSPHLCIQAARQGKCLSLTCEAILFELAVKLQTKRGFDAAKATAATDEIRAFSSIVTIPGTLKIVAADPDDDAVLECAVELGNYQGIRIVRASEFLRLLEASPTVQ